MRVFLLLLLVSFFLAACGPESVEGRDTPGEIPGETTLEAPSTPNSSAVPPQVPQETNSDEAPNVNPRSATLGEYSFSQLLPFDGIRPVYDPEFATPSQVQGLLREDELVLGISLADESKAYPISVLRFREMVNDEMAGIPTLVTW